MSADTQASHLTPFPPDYRACGVLLHVTSLPSPYGIGDLGPAAFAWIDSLYEAGPMWWQAVLLSSFPDSADRIGTSFTPNNVNHEHTIENV